MLTFTCIYIISLVRTMVYTSTLVCLFCLVVLVPALGVLTKLDSSYIINKYNIVWHCMMVDMYSRGI